MTLTFKYNTEKDRINRERFGISLKTAAYIFFDKNYMEMYDFERDTKDNYYVAIGNVNNILLVVTTIKGKDYTDVEIVSARLATDKERRVYYDRVLYN